MKKTKEILVDNFVDQLKKIAVNSLKKRRYGTALSAINAAGNTLYRWNQTYVDKDLDEYLLEISRNLITHTFRKEDADDMTIVFYDSFGADTRGLTIIYLLSLCELGYKIIYVTSDKYKNKQPVLSAAVINYHLEWEFLDKRDLADRTLQLCDILEKYKPSYAFLHITPADTTAICAFCGYEGTITRYLINLTDHAFWLGINAFDYCLEFRDYGATVSVKYRGINKDRIIMMPYYPYIDKNRPFEGFDFNYIGKKIVFSGGSIYKTTGDPENKFYWIIEHLLNTYEDVVFVYACSDNRCEQYFKDIIEKYPERCFVIKERKDLYQVLRHSTIYLNTFPLFGGLMTQYAIIAGRIPLTLVKEERKLNGIINNLNNVNFEFRDQYCLLLEAGKLLSDDDYRREQENALKGCVISENEFKDNLKYALINKKSIVPFTTDVIINNDSLRETFKKSFNYNDTKTFVLQGSIPLYKYYPFTVSTAILKKVIR